MYLGQVQTEHAGYSGSGFADYDMVKDSSLEWTVNRTQAGPVALTFRYANGGAENDRPMRIFVNGTLVDPAFPFPYTTSWKVWGTTSMVINLNQGINTIKAVANAQIGGPNIDYIKIH